jgi:hypothetical protein
MRDGTI